MTTKSLSKRQEFSAITSSEVMNPAHLPFAYRWMQKGFYAIYEGNLLNNDNNSTKVDWGLEVNYVNDHSQRGEPSSIGYTLYRGIDSESIGNWLSWPVLFVRFFDIEHHLDNEKVNIPSLGSVPCFKAVRGPEMYAGVNKTMWYDEKTSLLVKMDVSTLDGTKIYSCILSEFSPLFSQIHASLSSQMPCVSIGTQPVVSKQDSTPSRKAFDELDPHQEIEFEKERRNFVRAALLASQSGYDEKDVRALQRSALRQFIEEFHNFEGASVLVSEYRMSPSEVKGIVDETLANPEIATLRLICFDVGKIANRTLEARIRQWCRLL